MFLSMRPCRLTAGEDLRAKNARQVCRVSPTASRTKRPLCQGGPTTSYGFPTGFFDLQKSGHGIHCQFDQHLCRAVVLSADPRARAKTCSFPKALTATARLTRQLKLNPLTGGCHAPRLGEKRPQSRRHPQNYRVLVVGDHPSSHN